MYKSVIKGGGKFTKDYKRTYLSHCENLFNESSEETKEESRNYLLAELEKDVRKVIVTEYADADSETKRQLQKSVDIIFGRANKTAINRDRNHLGVVNVVSLQCVLLFTYAANNFVIVEKEDLDDLFNSIRNGIQYSQLDTNSDKDWRYYKNIDKSLLNNFYGKKINFEWHKPLGIITIIDFFTIDEILEQYLKFDKFYTGLLYKHEIVDDENMSPVDFIRHDIVHYQNFHRFCGDKKENIKNLYEFIKTTTQISQRNAAKLILYLYVHESGSRCSEFNDAHSLPIEDIKPLFNDNDLGKLIPQKYRYSEITRLQYLEYARATYKEAITQIEEKNNGTRELFAPTREPPQSIYKTDGFDSDDDFDPDIVDAKKESSGGKKTKRRKSKKTKRKGKKRTKSTNKKLI